MNVFKVITPTSGLIETLWCVEDKDPEEVRDKLIVEQSYPPNILVKKINN